MWRFTLKSLAFAILFICALIGIVVDRHPWKISRQLNVDAQSICFSGADKVVIFSTTKGICEIDLDEGKISLHASYNPLPYRAESIQASSNYVFCTYGFGAILFDKKSLKVKNRIKWNDKSPGGERLGILATLTPNEETMALSDYRGRIRLYSIQGVLIQEYANEEISTVSSLVFIDNETLFVSANSYSFMMNIKTGVSEKDYSSMGIKCLNYSSELASLAGKTINGDVAIYVYNNRKLERINHIELPISELGFRIDDKELVTTLTSAGDIVVIEQLYSRTIYSFNTSPVGIKHIAVSPDGKSIVGISDNKMFLWKKMRTERWWGYVFRFEIYIALLSGGILVWNIYNKFILKRRNHLYKKVEGHL